MQTCLYLVFTNLDLTPHAHTQRRAAHHQRSPLLLPLSHKDAVITKMRLQGWCTSSQPTMHLMEDCPLFLTSRFMCLALPMNVDKESQSLRTCDCASSISFDDELPILGSAEECRPRRRSRSRWLQAGGRKGTSGEGRARERIQKPRGNDSRRSPWDPLEGFLWHLEHQ